MKQLNKYTKLVKTKKKLRATKMTDDQPKYIYIEVKVNEKNKKLKDTEKCNQIN